MLSNVGLGLLHDASLETSFFKSCVGFAREECFVGDIDFHLLYLNGKPTSHPYQRAAVAQWTPLSILHSRAQEMATGVSKVHH